MKLLTFLQLTEARDRLSMNDAIDIVREIETGRGGIAELMKKKPHFKELTQAKLRSEYGDVVPLFRVLALPEGKEIREEGIVSTSTDWKVAYHMGRNQAGVVMTRDSFMTVHTVLLRYDTPVEQCLADVNMLLEMVVSALGGFERIGNQNIRGRSGPIAVAHIIQEGMKEDEVIADVTGIEPVVLDFDRKKELEMVQGMEAGEFDSPDEYMSHRDATKGTNEFFPPDEQEQIKAMYAKRAPDVKRFLGMNEELYHATTHDIDQFRPLSHFGTPKAAATRANAIKGQPDAPRTYKANMPVKNPIQMTDDGGHHDHAYQIAKGIVDYYEWKKEEPIEFELRELKLMMARWRFAGVRANDTKQRKELIHFLKSYGYDSIEYDNEVEGNDGSSSYINLDPVVAESVYDDGSVQASIEEWEGGVAISELSSYSAEAGKVVRQLKRKYGHVTVPNIGERDTESYAFWMKALKRGLVDEAFLSNGEMATPYSTQAGVTIKYNGEPKVGVMPQRSMNDSTVMMLPTAVMDAAFKRGGSDFYVGPNGSGAAIGKRYEGFQQWIAKYDQYELPEVGVRDNGIMGFTNGRHRYAVLRDAGVDPMPVAMGNHDIENAKKLGGVIRESVITEMADPAVMRDAAPKVLAQLKSFLVGSEKSELNNYANEAFFDDTGVTPDDPKYAEQFAIWKEGHAQQLFKQGIARLKQGLEYRDGKLLVHRMVGADGQFLDGITSRGLGKYWTWDKSAAKMYTNWSVEDQRKWTITGAIDPAVLDWAEILFLNTRPGASHEKEITIPEGTPVKILNIEMNGESVDPSLYGGRGTTLMAGKGS